MRTLPTKLFLKDVCIKKLLKLNVAFILTGSLLIGLAQSAQHVRKDQLTDGLSEAVSAEQDCSFEREAFGLEQLFEFRSLEQLAMKPLELFCHQSQWQQQVAEALAKAHITDKTDQYWGLKVYKDHEESFRLEDWPLYYKHTTVLSWILGLCIQNPPYSIEAIDILKAGYRLEMTASSAIVREWLQNPQLALAPIQISKITYRPLYPTDSVASKIEHLNCQCTLGFWLDPEIALAEQARDQYIYCLAPEFVFTRPAASELAETLQMPSEHAVAPAFELKGVYKLSEVTDTMQFLLYSVEDEQFFTLKLGEASALYNVRPLAFKKAALDDTAFAINHGVLQLEVVDLETIVELAL